MLLPALVSTAWSGRSQPGRTLVLVPTRELAIQHAALLRALLAGEKRVDRAVVSVTTSTVSTPAGLAAAAAALPACKAIVATPAELAAVLEHDSSLYMSLDVEALARLHRAR